MKRLLLCFLTITCWSVISRAQVKFENGHYINNLNQRIEGLIRNNAARNNPTNLWFKPSESNKEIKLSIEKVKEFEIYNNTKFIRVTVDLDQSSQSVNTLDNSWQPIFEKKTVFVKSLVEGQASLYSFINGNRELFFLSTDSSRIEQLVYKRYLKGRNNFGENNTFRKQLLDKLKCPDFTFKKMQQVVYSNSSLEKIIKKYNTCVGQEFLTFEKKQGKTKFNLSLRPRMNYSSTTTPNPVFTSANLSMDKKLGFGIGLETELVLPINKNKWSIIAEVVYQKFNSQNSFNTNNVSGGIVNTNLDYSSIEVPFGFRHYLFLNQKSKLFINTAYIFDFTLNNELEFTREDGSIIRSSSFSTLGSLSAGVGFKYLNKFSLELRNLTISNRAINYSNSEFNSFSIIFGYTFF